eukprot:1026567_1
MEPQWSRIYESTTEGITALLVQPLSVVLLFIALLHFIFVVILPKQRKGRGSSHYIQTLCIFCFIFAILYCLGNFIFHVIIVFKMEISCTSRSWTIFLLIIHRCFLYWFYIERAKITFEYSVLQIHDSSIRMLYCLSSGTIILSGIMHYYFQTTGGCADSVQTIIGVLPLLLDVFWCLFLSLWFIFKLHQSVVQYRNHEESGVDQVKLVLMIKMTNIIVWTSLVLEMGQWVFCYFTGWVVTAVSVNVVTVCIALLLTFNTYSMVYTNYICCVCHACVVKCCKLKLEKHIIKQSVQLKLKQKEIQELMGKQGKEHVEYDTPDTDQDPDSPLVKVVNRNISILRQQEDTDTDVHDEEYYE